MIRNLRAVRDEIGKGRIAAVYTVVGDEAWARGKFLDLIKATVIDPSTADFNFDLMSAAEAPAVQVIDRAMALPMMTDRRLIVVDQCEKWSKKDYDAAAKYFENPNEQTCLVLLFEKAADKRRKIFRFQSPLVRQLELPKPKPWELQDYIRELVQDQGLQLNDEAVALVAELAGDDLEKVHRELDKLSLYKLGSKQVDADDVAALMGRTRHATRWELNDLLGKRELQGALLKMHHILESGGEPIGLLSTITMFLKQLFLVKTAMVNGARDKGQIAQMLHVSPYIAKNLMAQQRAYSDVELRRAFKLARETDYRLKSAAMNKKLVMDHLLTQILVRGPHSPPSR